MKSGKPNNHLKLVTKFVQEERFKDKGFWPKEMKIAGTLIKNYNLNFLLWVIPPYGKKVPSLCYFIADYGQQYLQEQFFNYKKEQTNLTPKIQEIPLAETKIGDDVVIQSKPKTLREFLNLYK